MKVTTFGLNMARWGGYFQMRGIDMETGEICRRQLKRCEVAEYFAHRVPAPLPWKPVAART